MNIYAWDLEKGTTAGLRRALFQSELKNSFRRSRNRYRRYASAFADSSLRTPSLVKQLTSFSLVFSYLKNNSLVIPYLKIFLNFLKSLGVFKLKSDNYAATIN